MATCDFQRGGGSRPPVPPFWIFPCTFVFVFVALRPKSTAMVIAGRSVHLRALFPGQA